MRTGIMVMTKTLKEIDFGDVDAKNEILKQLRSGSQQFFESFSIPSTIELDDYFTGRKHFILGLKGTGKTALLRFIHKRIQDDKSLSELILFKSHVSEEDRQRLSNNSGYEIVSVEGVNTLVQDFKEAWKWFIYQRIAKLIYDSGNRSKVAKKIFAITGTSEDTLFQSIGALFSKVSSGSINLSVEAVGIAVELGADISLSDDGSSNSVAGINRVLSALLNDLEYDRSIYVLFDELELFYETVEQFDRDRRIIRDLVYAISSINAESAENARMLFLISSLRTEVLNSVLELGHEIGRDIDDYGDRLDWSSAKDSEEHPLLMLVGKKISSSTGVDQKHVWSTFFPDTIHGQPYYKFILNSSYYRPRDIIRLLRVAKNFRNSDQKFSQVHFDETAREYSKQTWLEVTEELLASYSTTEVSALQRLFLGFHTRFFVEDIEYRISTNSKRSLPHRHSWKRFYWSRWIQETQHSSLGV